MACSSWKLDKIDKIFISFVLILVTIFCVFDSLVFAADIPVDYYELDKNLVINGAYFVIEDGIGKIVSQTSASVFRVDLLNGSTYLTVSGPHNVRYFLSNDDSVSIGDSVENMSTLSGNSNVYIYNTENYKYLYISFYSDNTASVYTNAKNFDVVISGLIDVVNNDFFVTFENTIPYIGVVVLVGFGCYLIFRMIKGISKGKARL